MAALATVVWLRNRDRRTVNRCAELKNDKKAFVGRPQPEGKKDADKLVADGLVGIYSYAADATGKTVPLDRGVLAPFDSPMVLRRVKEPGSYGDVAADPVGAYPRRIQTAPLIRCPNTRCPTNQKYGDKMRRPQLNRTGGRGEVIYYRCSVCRDVNTQRPTTFKILVLEPDEFVRRFGNRMRTVKVPNSPPDAPPPLG